MNVLYGSSTGLTAAPVDHPSQEDQFISQDESGIPGVAESNDHSGAALASGDFDGDAYSDLAIGIPREDVDGIADRGAGLAMYGSTDGLDAGRTQSWTPAEVGVPKCGRDAIGFEVDGCRFGAALAWGDFNGDGRGGSGYRDAPAMADLPRPVGSVRANRSRGRRRNSGAARHR